APLEPTGEACTASTTQTGGFDGVYDPGVSFQQNILCAMPVTARLSGVSSIHIQRLSRSTHLCSLQSMVMPTVCISKNSVLIPQATISSNGCVLHRCERAS